MSRRNIPAIMIVLALLLGSLMIYATADLMGSMNPDPHSHRDSYDVVGTIDGDDVPGRATCTPVRENGAFYNYDFKTIMETEDGATVCASTKDAWNGIIADSTQKPIRMSANAISVVRLTLPGRIVASCARFSVWQFI